jgi:hypothetical protein
MSYFDEQGCFLLAVSFLEKNKMNSIKKGCGATMNLMA